MKRIRDLSKPSGVVGDVVWWTRQLTGTPYVHHGYVKLGESKMGCGHDHRKDMTARRCAERLARAVSERRVVVVNGGLGPDPAAT